MAKPQSPYAKKRKRWRYFFYGGDLHKLVTVNRGHDEAYAWNYPKRKRFVYSWSEVQRLGTPGFTLREAALIVGRSKRSVVEYMHRGYLRTPQRTYSLENGNPGKYFFSPEDIEDLHEVVKNIHFGRPRSDGAVTQRNVPNDREVRAASMHRLFLYARKEDDEGNAGFVPVWEAEEW